MQRGSRSTFIRAAAVGGLFVTSPAWAHIDLIDPPARAHGTAAGAADDDANTDQKAGPCGQVTNGRTDRVTTYAPGQTITVQVREETPHESYIRVALDRDGDNDFPLRPGPVAVETQEQAQAAEDALDSGSLLTVYRETNNTANFVHQIQVTLPDEPCDNCTLQVIQLMFATQQTYYFQCADIVIADGGGTTSPDAGSAGSASVGGAAGAGGSAGGSATAGSGGGPVAPGGGPASGGRAGGTATGAGGGSSGAPAGTAGSAPTGSAGSGAGVSNTPSDDDDDGGCSLSIPSGRNAGALSLFGVLAISLGLARRRRN